MPQHSCWRFLCSLGTYMYCLQVPAPPQGRQPPTHPPPVHTHPRPQQPGSAPVAFPAHVALLRQHLLSFLTAACSRFGAGGDMSRHRAAVVVACDALHAVHVYTVLCTWSPAGTSPRPPPCCCQLTCTHARHCCTTDSPSVHGAMARPATSHFDGHAVTITKQPPEPAGADACG